MSTSTSESQSEPDEAERARIRAVEIYRAEVRKEIASSRGKQVTYRVRIIHAADSLLEFGGTYPMTDRNEIEDQLESRLDYYRAACLLSDVRQRTH